MEASSGSEPESKDSSIELENDTSREPSIGFTVEHNSFSGSEQEPLPTFQLLAVGLPESHFECGPD
jgi:hypothetical protein